MGDALRHDMVLVFGVWNDAGSAMKWLGGTWPANSDPTKDPGTRRGPCKADEDTAEDILTNSLWISVKFIECQKWRDWVNIPEEDYPTVRKKSGKGEVDS